MLLSLTVTCRQRHWRWPAIWITADKRLQQLAARVLP